MMGSCSWRFTLAVNLELTNSAWRRMGWKQDYSLRILLFAFSISGRKTTYLIISHARVHGAPVAVQRVERPQQTEDVQRWVLRAHHLGEIRNHEDVGGIDCLRRVSLVPELVGRLPLALPLGALPLLAAASRVSLGGRGGGG